MTKTEQDIQKLEAEIGNAGSYELHNAYSMGLAVIALHEQTISEAYRLVETPSMGGSALNHSNTPSDAMALTYSTRLQQLAGLKFAAELVETSPLYLEACAIFEPMLAQRDALLAKLAEEVTARGEAQRKHVEAIEAAQAKANADPAVLKAKAAYEAFLAPAPIETPQPTIELPGLGRIKGS